MVDWSNQFKIRLANNGFHSKSFLKHEVVKLILVQNILKKYYKKKKRLEIYTEHPIAETKIADVYFKNNLTKEVICYEIQKNLSKKWAENTKKIYESKNIDWCLIDLNDLSDNLIILDEQVKEFVI